ncbi:MAG: GNAT family N-acetyltransferase [Candidatus Woesebacteria bacterium]|nr:GNAT family N-acetyltransferase [Candidatus Woesebacteria bacterium]
MIEIRKPKEKDLSKIREILAQWNDQEYTEIYFTRIKNEISGQTEFNMKFWVATDDEEVLGIIGLCDLSPDLLSFAKTPKPGQLKILYIDNKDRGKGIGKTLTQFVEKEASKNDYEELLVKSSEIYKNTAWGFYEKMSYKPVGLIDNKDNIKKSKIFEKILE